MDNFEEFCQVAKVSEQSEKIKTAILFIWYHQYKTGQSDITIPEINKYFDNAHLPHYNSTNLKSHLSKSKKVTKGAQSGSYKLSRKALEDYNKEVMPLLNYEEVITEKANINATPFLKTEDIEAARQMAGLYIIIHCFENSVRKFIEIVLKKKHGDSWWDKVKNADLDSKYKDRKSKELKHRWIGSRGDESPLFYIDWGDLVKIIKKCENDFNPFINDISFVELRLGELEKSRNVIAHNGMLPSPDDFDRIMLHFKDWCRQVIPQDIESI